MPDFLKPNGAFDEKAILAEASRRAGSNDVAALKFQESLIRARAAREQAQIIAKLEEGEWTEAESAEYEMLRKEKQFYPITRAGNELYSDAGSEMAALCGRVRDRVYTKFQKSIAGPSISRRDRRVRFLKTYFTRQQVESSFSRNFGEWAFLADVSEDQLDAVALDLVADLRFTKRLKMRNRALAAKRKEA